MPELSFHVESAEPLPFAVTPHLVFRLRVKQGQAQAGTEIQSIALGCQIRIEPIRRSYAGEERERLFELFGPVKDWGRTVRSLLWTHAQTTVPKFSGETLADLSVPCSHDFNAAGTKYFAALEDGEIPLCLLFSGTVFYQTPTSGLQIAQIPWEKETTFRLPVSVWKGMMDSYYPNSQWVCLRRDAFERIDGYKRTHALPSWELALEHLLDCAEHSTAVEAKVTS